MKTKQQERDNAIRLRQNGKSIKEIAKELSVSQSSVSCWVRKIQLTDRQRAVLEAKRSNSASSSGASKAYSMQCLNRRKEYQNQGRADAHKRDFLHIQTCMLYWAEGKKSRNVASIGNTDPNILRIFVECLKKFYKINQSAFKLRIRSYINNGLSENQIVDFWTKKLRLSKDNVSKVVFDGDSRIRTGKKKNIHPYGICEVNVSSTELVQRIFGAIQEYAGFNNKDWLM